MQWSYIEGKPRIGTAKEDLEVLPLAKVFPEIGERRFRSVNALNAFVLVDVGLPVLDDLGDIGLGPINVTFDIHSEARSFGDGQTEVQSDASGNASETDEEAPHMVDGREFGDVRFGKNCFLVSGGDNKGNERSSYEKTVQK